MIGVQEGKSEDNAESPQKEPAGGSRVEADKAIQPSVTARKGLTQLRRTRRIQTIVTDMPFK